MSDHTRLLFLIECERTCFEKNCKDFLNVFWKFLELFYLFNTQWDGENVSRKWTSTLAKYRRRRTMRIGKFNSTTICDIFTEENGNFLRRIFFKLSNSIL